MCLAARADPVGEGIAGQDSEEVICAYYVDTPSEDEEGATAEAQVADRLEDLELLFQEQLAVFAEDVAEQHTLKKGKAVATDPSLPQDHSSIMVLEEELEATSTNTTRKQEITRTNVLAKSSLSPCNLLANGFSEDFARISSPRIMLRR